MSRDKLAALEKLQEIDLEVEQLRKSADEVPARLSELESAVAQARSAADGERGRLADVERARHRVETTLSDDRERMKKWEQRLPGLKQPREFAALQREVDALKRASAENEEQINRYKAEEAALRASVQQLEADVTTREAEYAASTAELRGRETELREKLATLESRRDEAKTAVDPKLLSTYELVRRRRPGRTLVPAENGSCTACHRRLLPQTYNALLNGEVSQCQSCQRLVFAPPPPPLAE